MIILKPNATAIAEKLCRKDSVIAYYYSVCENYANGYIQPFITNMQILITKLGIVVSSASTTHKYISYCAQSLQYLCTTVLGRPDLEKTFDSLGLNDKGNKGKHSIEVNHIDMDKAVASYNNLVNLIINQYNLSSLKRLIVAKRYNDNQKPVATVPVSTPNNNNQPNKKAKKQHKPKPTTSATTSDERLSLSAELLRGDGYYKKGLFHKRKMLNFVLKLNIRNPDNLKVKSIVATFKCGGARQQIKITKIETPIDLDADIFSGNITASVEMVYKIGLIKSKTIKVSVAKQF